MKPVENTPKETENPWYVIRTFRRERVIRDALQEQGLHCFIPMKYRDDVGDIDETTEITDKELKPVVRGYVFVEKTKPEGQMREIFTSLNEPMGVTRNKETGRYYEIQAKDMRDFRMLCDPTYRDSVFITPRQAEARVGKNVTIVRGRFRGIKGKLCQIRGKYFFIKHVAGLGVMIHITRWFCRVDD